MSNSWLPMWLELLGVGSYALVMAVHVAHAWLLPGTGRVWHLGHVVMSLGMIDMFWPASMPVDGSVGEVVFAIAAIAAGVALVRSLARGDQSRIWLVSAVDFAAMAYMFAMMSHRSAAVTIVFVVWTVTEALWWASGRAFGVLRLVHSGADLRITLVLMSVGMGYMLVAMQYGRAQL